MKTSITIDTSAVTDQGLVREENEDSVFVVAHASVIGVADGMGGVEGGAMASQTVKRMIHRSLRSINSPSSFQDICHKIRTAVQAADLKIKEEAERLNVSGAGTTVAIMVFGKEEKKALCLHAGDSRIYRFRGKQLELLTRDHSLIEEIAENLRDQVPAMLRGVITRAIGSFDHSALEERIIDIEDRDLFLVCTDGLSNMLSDGAMTEILTKLEEADTHQLAIAMVHAANYMGGMDNISVALARVNAGMAPETE